jgi:hypothetical protein
MPDETKEKQDTSAKDASAKAEGSTSSEPTFTKADLDKAKSDALAAAGRTAKDLERREAEIKAKNEEYDKWKRAQAEKEEEEARQKPDGLTELQKKRERDKEAQKLKEDREALDREKAEHEADIAEAKEAKQEVTIWKVASELKVDPVILKERCAKYKLTTEENISDYAKEHAASLVQQEKKETPKVHPNTREMGGSTTKIGDLPPSERIKAIEKLLNQK